MPPRKRQQSNAMLYTLIAFVGLFIIATTFAVVYYVKAEDFRTREAAAQADRDVLANSAERGKLGSIVGAKANNETWIGKLAEHFDRSIALATGSVPQNTSAEVKVSTALQDVQSVLTLTQPYLNLASADPNTVGLARIIRSLKTTLDNTTNSEIKLKQQLAELQQKLNDIVTAVAEERQVLLAEKDMLQQKVNEVSQDYNDLRNLLNQTASQREQTLMAQLDKEKETAKQMNDELLRTQAESEMTRQMLVRAQQQVAAIKPPPDANVPAYQPDGKIILIDEANKVVHISIGTDSHVYQGLTFSVYDRGQAIPKDGKSKAEIEVFDIAKTFSAARIISSEEKRPILMGDSVANLIWDDNQTSVFVIAGDFDINKDGVIDRDADERLASLIEKWGGKVANEITVETNYLILGQKPPVLRKPTPEQIDIDPQATAKFDASQRRGDRYDQLQKQAQALWIPIIKYDNFLYFIGYKGQITRAGVF